MQEEQRSCNTGKARSEERRQSETQPRASAPPDGRGRIQLRWFAFIEDDGCEQLINIINGQA